MLAKWVTLSAAALLGIASFTQAAPKPLTDNNGVSSGWTWDVASNVEPFVNLVFIRSSGNQFFFEKDAEFRTNDVLAITFNKVDPNAKTLVINDETVLNNTGTDWNGFRLELSSGSTAGTPNFAFATSDNAPGIGDFRIDPFAAFQFYNANGGAANTGLLVNGGTAVKTGSTWFPGAQSNTGLAIVASGTDTTFTLKEIPQTGGTTVIPLPAAAWSGLSGLVGLALVAAVKKARHRLA
jgi:hypothetical protein